MAKPTIIRGSDHHFSFTYVGSGLGQRVGTFVPFTDNGTIAKSCMFEDGDEPELSRTPSGAGNRDIFTLSFWIKRCNIGALQLIFQHGADVNNCTQLSFDSSNRLQYQQVDGGGNTDSLVTNKTFEDLSKFYHIVLAADTTQSTEANRIRMYVDGNEITSWSTANYPSQNTDTDMNTTTEFSIGRQLGATTAYSPDCYLAEINYVDGTQYTPSTFGLTDTTTGIWIPKSLTGISYGTNGFRMQFANSAGQTIGDDTSGNGNDFTVSNIGTDQIKEDTPSQSFTNMNGDNTGGFTLAEGGLNVTSPGSGQYEQIVGLPNFGVATGKWYWEVRVHNKGATQLGWKSDDHVGGASAADTSTSPHTGSGAIGIGYNVGGSGGFADGEWTDDYSNAYSDFSTFSAASGGDIVMFALDLDNSKGYVGLNGTWFNSANPANGTGSIGLSTPATGKNKFYPMMLRLDGAGQNNFNFGQNRTFSNAFAKSAVANTASSGPGFFKYTPPTDFLAICQDNIPSSNKGIVSFAWADNLASGHNVFRDSSRGDETVFSPSTSMQASPRGIVEFLQGGYRLDQDDLVGGMDAADSDFVSWNWVGNNGTLAANTDGSGATLASTTQANQTAGFSIVLYTGDGNSNRKIAHGLSSAPEFIATRARGSASWYTYIKSAVAYDTTPQNRYFRFDSDDSHSDYDTPWADTVPTSSVFSIGSTQTNNNTTNYVAYCWHSVEGYSKIGSYHGNGQTDGPMVLTGFKPAWLLVKAINVGNGWRCFDNVRDKFNPRDKNSRINEAGGQLTGDNIDFLANGFKIQNNDGDINGSYHYIFMAFAERPFVGDGTNPGMAG